MKVEIVVHVYGAFYVKLLACQLESLNRLWENRIAARIFEVFRFSRRNIRQALEATTTVFCSDADVIHRIVPSPVGFSSAWTDHNGNVLAPSSGPAFTGVGELPLPQLLNRTIGRNLAAKATTADWVWFTDADYLFGPGSLEALTNLDPHAACMYFPHTVHKSTFFFDDEPDAVFDYSRYTPERQRKAIGGIQIVPSHIARQYGYLDGVERWHQPAVGDRMQDPREDHYYRRWLVAQTGLPIVAVDIPNVYRIRHRIPDTSVREHLLPMATP